MSRRGGSLLNLEATIGERFSEPPRTTALRTGIVALAIGLGVGLYLRRPAAIPTVTVVALWFTLGGHFAELFFRNQLAARMGGNLAAYVLARVLYWFAAGSVLYAGAVATFLVVSHRTHARWPWWIGGAGFVVAELAIHGLLLLRREGSVYNGRG